MYDLCYCSLRTAAARRLGGLGDLATIAGPVGVAAGSLLKLPRAVKASRGGAMPANQVGAIGDFTPANIITPNVSNAVSSRFPVAKGRVDDPLQEILLSDTAEMPKELLAKNAEVIRDYPGMGRLRSNASTDTIMGEFADLVGGNLMKVWDEMPTEMRDRAAQWYEGANKIRRGLANEYGISDAQASGIIAVLSPQNPWARCRMGGSALCSVLRPRRTRYTAAAASNSLKRLTA